MTKRQPLLWRILFFIGFFFVQNLSTVVLTLGSTQDGLQMAPLLFALFISLVFVGVMAFFIHSYQRQLQEYNPRSFGHDLSMRGKIKWIILTVVVIYGFLIVMTPLLPASESDNQQVIDSMFRSQALGLTLYGVILGPIIEELLYRGIFMNYFWNRNDRTSDVLAVVTSGLFFGLLHEPRLSLFLVVYTVIGISFGVLYLKTKDIRCSMIAHMLYNGITFMAMWSTL